MRIAVPLRGAGHRRRQRLVEPLESFGSDAGEQRFFVVEVPVERSPRNAELGADAAQRQGADPLVADHPHRRFDQRPLEVAVVVAAFGPLRRSDGAHTARIRDGVDIVNIMNYCMLTTATYGARHEQTAD